MTSLDHGDSIGNSGKIRAGAVQWMIAGHEFAGEVVAGGSHVHAFRMAADLIA